MVPRRAHPRGGLSAMHAVRRPAFGPPNATDPDADSGALPEGSEAQDASCNENLQARFWPGSGVVGSIIVVCARVLENPGSSATTRR